MDKLIIVMRFIKVTILSALLSLVLCPNSFAQEPTPSSSERDTHATPENSTVVDTEISDSLKAKVIDTLNSSREIAQPMNLTPVNSTKSDFAPFISGDAEILYFASSREGGQGGEDLWLCKQNSQGIWSTAENLGPVINSDANEGSLSMTPDGLEIYFTVCGKPGSFGSCDIYYSRWDGSQWSEPKNLGSRINTPEWDGHPSISADGTKLFFASKKYGTGFGGLDIYVSERTEDGWSYPKNIGYPINNARDQTSPFLHPDNRTLYFASDGHGGKGGLDIFKIELQDDGSWSEPKNLGPAVNTKGNDYFFSVSTDGNYIYYASDMMGGLGSFDIYKMELEDIMRPTTVTAVVGKVIDANTQKPLPATITIENFNTGEKEAELKTDPKTGEYFVILPVGEKYSIIMNSDGYVFSSDTLETNSRNDFKRVNKTFELKPIKVGEKIRINNIFFDFNSADIKPESEPELRRAIKLLTKHPNLEIRVAGYADSIGTEDYNLWLSSERAEAVRDYLIQHGIAANRLTSKGYGTSEPIASNETAEGRKLNRRTEFHIIKE